MPIKSNDLKNKTVQSNTLVIYAQEPTDKRCRVMLFMHILRL